ncbi:PTS lactose/cellobiose transporter subunit IIA [Streptococcus suis]|nr:PTS lactose/cellobiose transporter subunit IIA [Streptococcus suis]
MFTNVEDSMQIIANSGDARSDYMEAIRLASVGDLQAASQQMDMAKDKIVEAHRLQTELIQGEFRGDKAELNLLLIHAQDHLMSTLVIRDLSRYLLDLYQKLREKEKEI